MKLKLQFTANFTRLLALTLLLTLGGNAAWAQTTTFTYQGELTDGGAPANGPYDLQFKLFDAATGGNQVGATLTRDDVNATNGAFSTSLDFGAAAFPGAARWLEISARQGASTGAYTTLTPRQPITSTPYAIRALNATSADTVTGPVPASQLTGTLPPGVLAGLYIENTTTQQPDSNFNISGNGTAAGTLSGNVVNATMQYNLGGQRLLSASSSAHNFVAGLEAGISITTGAGNSYFGQAAGKLTDSGSGNSFFGDGAGASNTSGSFNSYFGSGVGLINRTGNKNSYFGNAAGGNTVRGDENSAFGYFAGLNTNGFGNAIFGSEAGIRTSSANHNSFFGRRAGYNTSGDSNAFFGASAGLSNTIGGANAFLGAFAGQNNVDGGSNTFAGFESGYKVTGGSFNAFFGRGAGYGTTIGALNAFFGAQAGNFTTTGNENSFFGAVAGANNITGTRNTFLGFGAAPLHTTGDNNTFVGYNSGANQTNGVNNTLIGASTGVVNQNLNYATAIGAGAEVGTNNTVVLGRRAGQDRVLIPGPVDLLSIPGGGSGPLCTDVVRVSRCSSSLRYKTNVESLTSGLNLIQRLRPVTFDWKSRNEHDLGFIAEEVAEVEPLLTFRNEKGEIEGVKYAQMSAVLVNAVKEQQAQIEQLKNIVCADHPDAAVCKPKAQ
jgi:hypothetical protein